jgi:hypothetical protein
LIFIACLASLLSARVLTALLSLTAAAVRDQALSTQAIVWQPMQAVTSRPATIISTTRRCVRVTPFFLT